MPSATASRSRRMEMIVNMANCALVLVAALALTACVHSHQTLSNPPAPIGELIHTEAGSGTLSIEYAGKRYTGEYEWQPSRWIQGKRQRHMGRVARTTLVAPDGDTVFCDIQWGAGLRPAGSCQNSTGKSFYLQFN